MQDLHISPHMDLIISRVNTCRREKETNTGLLTCYPASVNMYQTLLFLRHLLKPDRKEKKNGRSLVLVINLVQLNKTMLG